MKLLFDQNISFRLVEKIADIFPGSSQIRLEALENTEDLVIWKYAKDHGFTLVTFDTDFYDISLLRGHPPKIIWLRIGNTSTKNLASFLAYNFDAIKEFNDNPVYNDLNCLELDY